MSRADHLSLPMHATSARPLTIVVAARQRSGSTFLAESIWERAKNMTNGASEDEPWFLDEPWIAAQERPANKDIEEMVHWPVDRRLENPLGYIQALHSARCHQLHQSKSWRGACKFTIVLKLFDIHYTNSIFKQANASMLRPLFSDPSSRVVVLERDPISQHCSLMWAEKTNHWWLPETPESSRKAYEAFKRDKCSHTAITSERRAFIRDHERWFATVHEALRTAPDGLRRSMNVTYDDLMDHHSALMARIEKQLLRA